MMAPSTGVDKDLKDLLLRDLPLFLALAILKGYVGAADEETEVRAGLTLLR